MAIKMRPGGKDRNTTSEPPNAAEVMAELFQEPAAPAPSVVVPKQRAARARRAGPFKIPASMAPSADSDRYSLARRFQKHLRAVSGSSKIGSSPDEEVLNPRPVTARGRVVGQRSGGFMPRPNPMSRFGRPDMGHNDDVDDDE